MPQKFEKYNFDVHFLFHLCGVALLSQEKFFFEAFRCLMKILDLSKWEWFSLCLQEAAISRALVVKTKPM